MEYKNITPYIECYIPCHRTLCARSMFPSCSAMAIKPRN